MFLNKLPNKSGYYFVRWCGEGDKEVKIYINCLNIDNEMFVTWGWNEFDDPEYLNFDEYPNMDFKAI